MWRRRAFVGGRRDILVETEKVIRIVALLELRQAFERAPRISGADAVFSLLVKEVDINNARR